MWFNINYQNTRNRIFDNSQVTRGGLFHNTAIFGEPSDEANIGEWAKSSVTVSLLILNHVINRADS